MISNNPSYLNDVTPEQFVQFRQNLERQRVRTPKEVTVRQYPVSDTKDQYQCIACHDIGYVRVEKETGNETVPCDGVEKKGCPIYQKNVFTSLKKFSVPPADLEYMQADWTTFPSAIDKMALGKARRYSQRVSNRDLKQDLRGMLLYGKNQIGKTGLAYCIHQDVLAVGLPSIFIDAITFFQRLHAAMFEKDNPGRGRWLMNQLCRVYHLVIDDLGAEKMSETREEHLFTLLNRRTKSNVVTTITSNLDGNALQEAIRTRCYARLAGRVIRQVKVNGGFCELTKDTGREKV